MALSEDVQTEIIAYIGTKIPEGARFFLVVITEEGAANAMGNIPQRELPELFDILADAELGKPTYVDRNN